MFLRHDFHFLQVWIYNKDKRISSWQLGDVWDFRNYTHSQAENNYNNRPRAVEMHPVLYPFSSKEYGVALLHSNEDNFAAGGAVYEYADFVLLSEKSKTEPQLPIVAVPFRCSWFKSGCFFPPEQWEKIRERPLQALGCWVEYEDRVDMEIMSESGAENYRWAFIAVLKYTESGPSGMRSNARSHRLSGLLRLDANAKDQVSWESRFKDFPFCAPTSKAMQKLNVFQSEMDAWTKD